MTALRPPAPRFVAGLSAQGAARLVGFAVAAVTAPLVARYLGPSGYGEFTLVVTVLFFLGMLGEFGLPLLAGREWPQLAGEDERQQWLASFWGSRHLLTAATLLLGVAAAAFLPYGATVRTGVLIGLVGLVATLTAGAASGLFTAELRPLPPAAFELAARLGWLAAAVGVVLLGGTVLGMVGGLAASQVLAAMLLVYLVRRHGLAGNLRRGVARAAGLLRRGLPLAPLPILGVAYARADILILAHYGSSAEVGVYGVIWRIVELLMILVAVLGSFFLPLFASSNSEEQRILYRRFVRVLAAGMIPMAVAVALLARPLLLLIGGSDFLEPTLLAERTIRPETALAVAMAAFALMSVGNVNGSLLVARGLTGQMIRHFLLTIGANVALAVVLIPRYSYLGAAAASLGSEAVAIFHSSWLVHRQLGSLRLASSVGWPVVAGVAVLAGLLSPLPLLARLAVAAALGSLATWIAIRSDLRAVLAAARGERPSP